MSRVQIPSLTLKKMQVRTPAKECRPGFTSWRVRFWEQIGSRLRLSRDLLTALAWRASGFKGDRVADETNLIWARLRERRWSLQDGPLLKNSSSRRNTLGAAMTQFEEQMTAASVVSSVTRPINLYYALAQAGLAISATHTPGIYTPSSHGLKIVNPDAELPDITVRVDAGQLRGSYSTVSDAVGSGVILSAVSIGALWGSLPDLEFMPLPGSAYPEVIPMVPEIPMKLRRESDISFPSGIPPIAAIYIDPRSEPRQATNAWLADILKPYPGADSCVLYPTLSADAIERGSSKLQVNIAWSFSGGNLLDKDMRAFFDSIAPAYRYTSERYLRPSIKGRAFGTPSAGPVARTQAGTAMPSSGNA